MDIHLTTVLTVHSRTKCQRHSLLFDPKKKTIMRAKAANYEKITQTNDGTRTIPNIQYNYNATSRVKSKPFCEQTENGLLYSK